VFGKRLRRTTEGVTCNTNKILELEVRIADLEKQVQGQQELIIHSAKSVNQDSQTLRLTLKEIKNNMISSIEALKNEIVEDVKQEVMQSERQMETVQPNNRGGTSVYCRETAQHGQTFARRKR